MNANQLRTSNMAAVVALFKQTLAPRYEENRNRLEHGLITTANASLFSQSHFSEPLHTYALGWRDPADYRALSDFVAPQVITGGDLFEHIEYPNAEAFLAEVSGDDDLRAINAEFKTVDYTESKTRRSIPNRGLRMVVDYDRVKNKPNWQQIFTDRLLQRLERNAAIRKVALALAAGAAVSKTWGSTANPDMDIANERKNSADITGVSPNRVLIGEGARLLRVTAYGAQATAAGFAGLVGTAEDGMRKVGLQAMIDESRYQSGVTKTPIVGSKVLLFNAQSQSGEDPSNFKSARGTTQQGGQWGTYVRQLTTKFWEIVVETYEMEWVASTLGVRTITVS